LVDKEAAQYIWGIGLHWYSNEMTKHEPIMKTHNLFPETAIFATEACAGEIY
jgi:glucosylceramidase